MSFARTVMALLATSMLTCLHASLSVGAETGGDPNTSVYFLRLFGFDDPGKDWKWDKRALRMFNQILLVKQGEGGSRLPQLVFREVKADSAIETPSALRAYLEASRDRPPQQRDESHEILSYEFQPDSCFGGMSAWFTWRTVVKNIKSGKPKRIEVVRGYLVRHPIERHLLARVQFLWLLSPDQSPIVAAENEVAFLREGISLRMNIGESRYSRCPDR